MDPHMSHLDATIPRGELRPLGVWSPNQIAPTFGGPPLVEYLRRTRETIHVVADPRTGHLGLASGGYLTPGNFDTTESDCLWMATLPPLYPEWLGDRSFCEAHGVRFPYVAGAMARGIASAEMVISMARSQMLAFLGCAGLSPARVERDLNIIDGAIGNTDLPWGANLIHSPNEPYIEQQVVELFLARGVSTVSASAFMKLTPPLVQYAATGLTADAQGRVIRRNHVVAKVSRAEVARRFLEPAPKRMLDELVRQGKLTEAEAQIASRIPVAEDITAEADSGGHTDGRPLTALLPAINDLATKIAEERGYERPIRVGAAGGIGTPTAAAAAFALGAAYVLTGSINQCSVEADVADDAKKMLAGASRTDVARCPSADMFEIGAQVQVLSRGTMFAARANLLGDLYRRHDGLHDIPDDKRAQLEKQLFRAPLDEIWRQTRDFWQSEDPEQVEKAQKNPRHKMALVFRWYLGKSSRWPIDGDSDRRLDYQLWCGPAQGAFNEWVQDTFLEDPTHRGVVQIALNILEGAAQITRAQQARSYGVHLPAAAFTYEPTPLA